MHDIFGPGSNLDKRLVRDWSELTERVKAFRKLNSGGLVVLTSGTFDLLHIGHSRYLEHGKHLANGGGILIVGVDSDEKVRKRKGPDRPIVHELERAEILCHLRHVDLVTLKPADVERWGLIKAVTPDVLLVTREEYDTPETIKALEDFCATFNGKVVILEPQATTSTTARIRLLILGLKEKVKSRLQEVIQWIDETEQ